jgi:hypothetical protein
MMGLIFLPIFSSSGAVNLIPPTGSLAVNIYF